MADKLLSTLAVLKANWDSNNRTYLDNFVPFVVDAAVSTGQDRVPIPDIAALVRERFGIPMPDGVVATVVKKAIRQGFGSRDENCFVLDAQRSAASDLTADRAKAVRQERALLAKLVDFAKGHFDTELTENEAEVALLAHVERHAVPLLRMILKGEGYEGSLVDEHAAQDFIVSSFILDLSHRDPEGFDYLESIVKGSMLASVLYLPTPAQVDRSFQKTTLYFDTPILLKALGYEGDPARDAARELLDLAYRSGADLACFEHTVDEVRGVLSSNATALSRLGKGGTPARGVEAYFIANKVTPSDVELILARLEKNIASLRVVVREKPPAVEALTVDERELETALAEDVLYARRGTLLNDLDSLTATFRARRGQTSAQLETARAVFVTSNSSLYGVARRFFYSGQRDVWPVAMGDHELGTLLWLKLPLAAPSLPQRQVIADCLAAMEPGPRLWGAYLLEIDKLKEQSDLSESDYFLLRYTTEAKQALMEKTLGSAEYVSPELVDQVLEEARVALTEPHRKIAQEANELHDEAEKRAAAMEQQLDAIKQQIEAVTAAQTAAEQRNLSVAEAIHERAVRRARPLGKAPLWLLVAVVAAAGFLSLPTSLEVAPDQLSSGWRLAARLICGAAILVATYFLISEHSPRQLARRIELKCARRFENRHRRQIGLPPLVES